MLLIFQLFSITLHADDDMDSFSYLPHIVTCENSPIKQSHTRISYGYSLRTSIVVPVIVQYNVWLKYMEVKGD